MKRVEISLKEILVYVLRRWKPIAAFACVMALLLGGYAYLRQHSGRADTASNIDTVAATDEAVDSSNRSTTLSMNIDLINFNPDVGVPKNEIYDSLGARYLVIAKGAPLAEIWDGIAPEKLSNIDLHKYLKVEIPSAGIINIVVAEANGIDSKTAAEALYGYMLAQTDSSIRSTTLSMNIDLINFSPDVGIPKNDIYASLGSRYLAIANGAPLTEIWDGIAAEEFDDVDLQNYVKVVSPSAGMINIIVSKKDGIDSRTAAEALYMYMLGQTEAFSSAVHEHTLSMLATNETEETFPSTVDAHKLSILAISETELTSESALKSLDFKPFGKAYIGSAIIGLLIGLVIGIVTFIVYYLFALPVQIPEQIQRQLGVRYLGGVRRKKHFSFGDRLAGSLRLANEEQAMKIISANLNEFAGNHKRILVTGTISEALIKEFVAKILGESKAEDIYFSYGADINKDANTIAKLVDSDTVVLVERLDVSKLKRVNEEKERLDMSCKEILGYVLF